MEKKIIAAVSVVILLVSVLAACAKKPPVIVTKEGMTFPLMTDSEGNTMVNKHGDLVVMVTGDDGKPIKNADGEYETAAVTFPDIIVGKLTVETSDFIMNYPKNWVVNEDGSAHRKGVDDESVTIDKLGPMKEGETFDSFYAKQVELGKTIGEQLKKDGQTTEYNSANGIITSKSIPCRTIEFKILNSDGTTASFSTAVYVVFGDNMYKVLYTGSTSSKEDALEILNIIDDGLVMKEIAKN